MINDRSMEILKQFESLGDNCEFGLVQRHFGVEGIGLLRWGQVQSGMPGLLSVMNRRLDGAGSDVVIYVQTNEYISRDNTFGMVFHTDKMVGSTDVDRLVSTETGRIRFLSQKLIEDIEQELKILVYKSSAKLTLEQVQNLHSALMGIGPGASLLWVVEAVTPDQVGTVEVMGRNLFKGYIDRFSPTDNVLSYCSFDVWLRLCSATLDLKNNVAAEKPADPTIPSALELSVYRDLWPDLQQLSDEQVIHHYNLYGVNEGRQANHLARLADFVNLIPGNANALEIGPFWKPLLSGAGARFFDVLDQDQLKERAQASGLPASSVPPIDYVSNDGDLSIVDKTFDYVISSHCIEHQPDLIRHLQQVEALLNEGGRYFLVVPDKRYCFDALLTETSIADVLDAYYANRTRHTMKSVIEHRALTTHNDWALHWGGDHGSVENQESRIADAIQEYVKANGAYVDVHAWFFTPASIRALFSSLQSMSYINLEIEQLYPTRINENEFRLILRKAK